MENNNREHFVNLAQAKREADEYYPMVSPGTERIARFFWWIVSGMAAGVILVTIWVTNINSNMLGFEKRITSEESTTRLVDVRFRADDLTHLQTNQQIAAVQKELELRTPLTDQVRELWFMKEHGISNKEDFISKHGFSPPSMESESPSPTPKR